MNYLNLSATDWNFLELLKIVLALKPGQKTIKMLQACIQDMLDIPYALMTNLGRTALIIGLKTLDLRKDDRIIVPDIVCPTVIKAILASDCRPILVDVEKNLHLSVRILEDCKAMNAKAVIVPHLYGLCAPIDKIEKWAEAKNLYLVDDAAQAVGISIVGKYLGTFGDMGILSFGPFKNLAVSRGGALISNSKEFIDRAKQYTLSLEKPLHVVRRLASSILKFHLRSYFLSIIYRIGNKNPRKNKKALEEPKIEQFFFDQSFQLSTIEAHLIYNVLKRKESILAKRSDIALRVSKMLEDFHQFEFVGPNDAPYVKIPIRILSDINATDAVRTFRALKIEANTIYRPLHSYPQYAKFAPYLLQSSEENWNKVFLISNPVRYGFNGIRRLGIAFKTLSKF
jgi:dTDP-4-amino-4,6-dideoxygalactose transaminase